MRAPTPPSSTITLALYALAMVVGAWLIARASFTADLSAFLPASPDAEQALLIDQLKHGVASRSLMVGIEGGDAAARQQASRALAARLRAASPFTSVNNGERGDFAAAGERLATHRYVLSDAITPERFTPQGLQEALQDTALRLATPEGVAFKAFWPRDPTGEILRIAEGLIPAQSPRMQDGVWVSRDAKRSLLLLTLKAGSEDIDAQAQAVRDVEAAFAAVNASGLTLRISGPGVFAMQSRELIEREVQRLSIFGTLGVVLVLWLAFGRLGAVALAAVPVATGVVAGIAAVSLVFGQVHGMTLGFGATLVGESVDYAIYYLIQARPNAATGISHWWRSGWPTVRLGLLTSLCGFAALAFSGFPGLAQLGVFSLAGLTAAALATRYVLPVLAPHGTPGQGTRLQLEQWTGRAAAWLPRWRWPLMLLTVIALAFLLASPQRLWRGDLQSMSPVPRAAMTLDAELRQDLGASDARTLVVARGATKDAALVAAEKAGAVLGILVGDGVLAGFDTPTRLLPSVATQAARRAALPDAAALETLLTEATRGLPFRASQIQPFIADVQAARRQPPLTAEVYRDTPLAMVVESLNFQRGDGSWAALLPLQWADAAASLAGDERATASAANAAEHTLRRALQSVPDAVVLDVKRSLDALHDHYMQEALWQSALGAMAVLLLLALVLKNLRRWVAVTMPLLMAVVLTLAVLALLEVPLGILHLVGTLLVVAVGSNYALFFDHLRHTGHDDDHTLASLLLANATTVITFGLMAASNIAVLAAIGMVVAPGAFLSLLLSAALMGPRSRSPQVEALRARA